MDTGSHLLFGVTLAGLAHLNPTVAENPTLGMAVMTGTLIGSHAPDFDTVARLKGFSSYVKYHRGITHSIPALFIWPLVITALLILGFGLSHWSALYFWTFLAIVFHVFLDSFNSYGVQSIRPFKKKWIHLDILAIFEPFLFLLHLLGAVLWLNFNYDPVKLFSAIYVITFGYIGFRMFHHHFLLQEVKKHIGEDGIYHVIPTLHWFYWRFIVETDHSFYTGKIEYNKVILEDNYSKEEKNKIIQATIGTDGVRTFLGFAQRVHVTYKELQDGYEVRWSDVRFWHNNRLPFGVDVRLDKNLNVVAQSFGWRKKAWDPPFL